MPPPMASRRVMTGCAMSRKAVSWFGESGVAAGRATLPVAPGEDAPGQVSGTVMAAHPPKVFTAARLRGWR